MFPGGSYKVASFASNTTAEIHRLDAQVDLFWPTEVELLMRVGLRDGMHILDCGCGPGRFLQQLKRRLPALKCVGLEIDPILIEACRKRMVENSVSDCDIREGTAENPGLTPESFDLVILRLVLEHVPDPLAALRGLLPLLRFGGRIVVISNDFEFHLRTFPPVQELDTLYKAYCNSRRKDGGDPCIGRRVPRLLEEVGLKIAACEIVLAHNSLTGDVPFLKAEGAGIPAQLVASGFLDEGCLERMTRSWQSMLDTPDHCIARQLWIAVGERSAVCTKNQPSSKMGELPRGQTTGREYNGTLEMLLGFLADILKLDTVDRNASMVALGMDSISAIALQERIKDYCQVEIPILRFFLDEPIHVFADLVEAKSGLTSSGGTKPSAKKDESTKWEEGEI